jgi:TetR/AcrR family transcriptional regulator
MIDQKKLTRREREKIRQRQEMLEAALSLFSEKGYHNVTMHEIAGKAEFAIGTLYKFFKSKEDLYKALILEKSEEFKMKISEAIEANENEVEKLRTFVKTKGEFFQTNIAVIRLYFSETHGESLGLLSDLYSDVRKLKSEFMKTLASVFASGIKKRRFKPITDPYYLAVALDEITTSLFFLSFEAPERHPYPEDPDAILNILFKGLLNQ